LVVCTKYALDIWRSQGQPRDPGDLRRFGMSGAVFHPVNLHPNNSAISGVDTGVMEIGQILTSSGASTVTTQFIALANLIVTELSSIRTVLNTHKHTGVTTGSGSSAVSDTLYRAVAAPTQSDVGSVTVKVSE